MKRCFALLVIVGGMLAPLPSSAAGGATDLRLYWKDGLRMESADKQLRFKIGGRIMNDWAWIDADDDLEASVGTQTNGTQFRRARLYVAGELYERIVFKAQYDFAGGDADFKDVLLGIKHVPFLGEIRVGRFKEPMGLEELTSSKYITFMERSLTSPFVAGRNSGFGFQANALDQNLTYAAGVFLDTDGFGTSKDDKYNISMRVTGTPINREGTLVHLGVSYRHSDFANSQVNLGARPEVHLADKFVNTGTFTASDGDTVGAEFAAIVGPASLQAEYFWMGTNASASSDPHFQGLYAMASYFVTGESRHYDPKKGIFKRVTPRSNFLSGEGGCGAWEVAARFSTLDLSDESIDGGEIWNVTAGMNWHLNPNTRVMLNYIHSRVDEGGLTGNADADMVQTRFQIDF